MKISNGVKDCLFCNIAKKELPSDVIYEDDEVIGFKNIYPEAPVHLLFIPKRHIEWGDKFSGKESLIIAGIISAAKKVALEQKIFAACKFIFNVGETGHIAHIHLHLLGGWKGEIPLRNI